MSESGSNVEAIEMNGSTASSSTELSASVSSPTGPASPTSTTSLTSGQSSTETKHGAEDLGEVTLDIGDEPRKSRKGKKKKRKSRTAEATAVEESFKNLTEELHGKHRSLRITSMIASFIHTATTILMFVMGYSSNAQMKDGVPDKHANEVVVLMAFGCLATCVYSWTSTWHSFDVTSKSITSRQYHNASSLAATIRGFMLIFFLWPGLVIYMLHSQGFNIFTVVNDVICKDASSCSLKTLIGFHVAVALLVAAIDIFGFMFATGLMRDFKQINFDELDQPEQKEEKAVVLAIELEEEEKKPIKRSIYVVAFITPLLQCGFIVVLGFMAAESINSANIGAIVILILFLVLFIFLGYRFFSDPERVYTKRHLLYYRVYNMLHLTAVVAVFWISFAILFFEKAIDKSFFEAVFNLAADRIALCVLQVIMFLATMADYGVLLYFHQKSLAVLEELASLNLRERMIDI